MVAIEILNPGSAGVLKPVERPTPSPGADEVLIKAAAAGVNRPDVMQRRGAYPPPPGAPDIPGLEVAGEIAAVGDRVRAWRVGDRACALVSGGGYAEYCLAPAVQCLPIPSGLTLVEAAGLPETVFTVWTNVFDAGRLAQGESLLVHGGSSGIGTTAIQMAKAKGARVFATAGSPEKCAACERLGAERAINYKDEDFAQAITSATGGRGVDVILDMVAGDYTTRNLQCLATRGRLVIIAFLRGASAQVNLLPILQKRLIVTGSALRPRSVDEKGRIADAVREHVWPLIEAGAVKPVIHAVLPLTEAQRAHEMLEEGSHIGKIVLSV